MAIVGIIANPAAGKDIRRLVAHGRVVPNQEKVNALRRILAGLDAAEIETVLFMPDSAMLGRAALSSLSPELDVRFLDMPVFNEECDSSRAAEMMADSGADCIVTLGGDGTNRAVAKGCGDIPLVPVSTGTNNVFPSMVEGTIAGLAAGIAARGLVDMATTTSASKRLEVNLDGTLNDIALIDLAVSKERFVGSRAIWDMSSVHEIFLARADPSSIGLSAIGAQLHALSAGEDEGVYVRLGPGGITVRAPVAPGSIVPIEVAEWRPLRLNESAEIGLSPSTIALDGERTFSMLPGQTASVRLSDRGPRVVNVEAVLREAARRRVFVLSGCQSPTTRQA